MQLTEMQCFSYQEPPQNIAKLRKTLQNIAKHCKTLRNIAEYCGILRNIAEYCGMKIDAIRYISITYVKYCEIADFAEGLVFLENSSK